MRKLLLETSHLQKSYGDRIILDTEPLRIYDGERIALIGENGAGKSTLLSILAGETEPDTGSVKRVGRCAFIHQSGEARLEGRGSTASRFRAPDRRTGLSGGEMTRRRIAEALSADASLLFADEPTTDLDASGARELLEELRSWHGALLLVSHDRALLNALCTRVLHLEDGRIADFPGTYGEYREELQRRREFQQFEYDRYRAEQARLKAMAQQKAEWAASVKKAPKRMGNSEARLHTREYTNAVLRQSAAKKVIQDRMDRLEKKERPRDTPDIRMSLGVSCPIRAKTAVSVRLDALTAGRRLLISGAAFTLPTGSRTALCGDNGCGKTTLLRALRGEPSPGTRFDGDIRFNPGVRMGWFDQDHEKVLDLDASVLENAMSATTLSGSLVRTVLARMNLRGDSVFKTARVLSGGERAKLALARLLVSDINLLILDEPTNHLDLFTLEALEALLRDHGGTLLFVSHDRAFVSRVADRILTVANGGLTTFEGSLEQMEEASRRDRSAESLRLERSTLEMRLAALAARISSPQKGDQPDELKSEYDALAAKLRELRQREHRGPA